MIENLKLKKVNAPKDLPLLASLSMAVPILIGLLSNNLKLGMTASLAAILAIIGWVVHLDSYQFIRLDWFLALTW